MAGDIVVSIVTILVVIALFVPMLFSRRLHYALGGIILLAIGTLTILFESGKTGFDVGEYPILHYAVYFFIVLAGKDLLKEGFKEKESVLKYPSIVLGIVLVVLTTIPTLNKLHVIDWAIPKYSPIIDGILYIVSGVFLLVGIFTLFAEHKE